MRLLRILVAVAVIGGSIVLAAASIYELTRTGTCGAPPGAVAIRACPEGTGTDVLFLILGIFVLPFVGMGISPTARVFLGGMWWCFVWIAMGAAALVAGYGPGAPPNAEDGALGVGITFLAIGGVSLIGVVIAAVVAHKSLTPEDLRARIVKEQERRAAPKAKPPAPKPPADQFADRQMSTLAQQLGAVAQARTATDGEPLAARLRKLDELRKAGVITDAEHAHRRQEILDEV